MTSSVLDKELRYLNVFHDFLGRELMSAYKVTLVSEVDLTQIETLRINESDRPSYTALLVKAVGNTLQKHPGCNRRVLTTWRGKRFQQFNDSDIAVAIEKIELNNVAYIEIIRNADKSSLTEITKTLREWSVNERSDHAQNPNWSALSQLVERFPSWIASRLMSFPLLSKALWKQYRGGAVLISSPGKYGPDQILGTWASPLGFSYGYIKERPVVRDGVLAVAKTMFVSMSFDRRVMGGGPAARFFDDVVSSLENPTLLGTV